MVELGYSAEEISKVTGVSEIEIPDLVEDDEIGEGV